MLLFVTLHSSICVPVYRRSWAHVRDPWFSERLGTWKSLRAVMSAELPSPALLKRRVRRSGPLLRTIEPAREPFRGFREQVCRFFLDTPRPPAGAPEDEEKEDVTACAGRVDVYLTPDVAAAEGTTPLHWACWGAHLATCRLLVSRGADHRKVNAHGCNVAHWCGLAGDLDVCRFERICFCLQGQLPGAALPRLRETVVDRNR